METDGLIQTYGYGGNTNLHPLAAVILLVAAVLILRLQGKLCMIPFFVVMLLIPYGQVLVIGGASFMLARILLIFLGVKAFWIDTGQTIRINRFDKMVVTWVAASVITYTLLWMAPGAFVFRMGFAFDALLMYFVSRKYIRNFDDLDLIIKVQIFAAVLIAILMISEQKTGHNLLSIFGGVPGITVARNAKLRSQAAFAHPIIAGSFGATLFPLVISHLWSRSPRKVAVITGSLACIAIVIASGSSGPIMTLFIGIVTLLMWPHRLKIRKLKWGFVFMLVVLQIFMEAPVWALLGRIDLVGGSTGYHRYKIIDNFITRFGEWWLFGVRSTKHWGWMMDDTCQEYVMRGVRGGLISLVLFIVLFISVLSTMGKIIRHHGNDLGLQHRIWSFIAAVITHLVAFLGISYFDQSAFLMYFLLAVSSSFEDQYLKRPSSLTANFS